MMRATLLLAGMFLLVGCESLGKSGGNDNIRPSATSNPAATTNLKLAIEYMQERQYEKALEKLDRARQADPGYALTYNTYGVLYQTLGDNVRAEQNFKKALSLGGDDSPTMNNYGRFLCLQNRVDEAEKILLKAAANPLYETPEVPVTNAGICMQQAGRTADAEKNFRRALELNPKMSLALLQMTRLTFEQGDALKARGYLQRYLEVGKHTPETLWLGIQIERQLGDKDTAASYAMLLRNKFPDSEEARLLGGDQARP